MLASTKKLVGRGVSTIGTLLMFVLMLPLAFAAMVIMMFAGIFALANIRHRLREGQLDARWQTGVGDADRAKPPIEGSFSVVQD